MSIIRAFGGTFPSLILAGVGAIICTGASAQQFMDTGTSQVTVDLGVIEDSGYGAGYGSPAPGGRRLLLPGPVMPVSRLLVPPLEGIAPPPPPPETKTVKLTPPPEISKPSPPPAQTLAPGLAMRVMFPDKASKLPAEAKDELKGIAAKLKGRDDYRLQLLAYAGGESLSSSKARRLSLSRALSVRSFLIESGVHSTRIDVRALGNKSAEGPINRVDVNIAER